MTDPIAEGLSVAGLVVGFPLLLLAVLIILERLETWGLEESAPDDDAHPADAVNAAVEDVEQLQALTDEIEVQSTSARSSGQ